MLALRARNLVAILLAFCAALMVSAAPLSAATIVDSSATDWRFAPIKPPASDSASGSPGGLSPTPPRPKRKDPKKPSKIPEGGGLGNGSSGSSGSSTADDDNADSSAPANSTNPDQPATADPKTAVLVSGDQDFVANNFKSPACLTGNIATLSARSYAACTRSGTPQTRYPIGNYNFDVVDQSTGGIMERFTGGIIKSGDGFSVTGLFNSLLFTLASLAWVLTLHVLNLMMTGVAWLLSFSFFTVDRGAGLMEEKLNQSSRVITFAWLNFIGVMLGIWVVYDGLIKRKAAKAMGNLLAAVVCVVVAMVIMQMPNETVGRVAEISDKATMTFVAAPTNASLDAPERRYNDLMYQLWDKIVMHPWCVVQFNDVKWCKGAPSKDETSASRGIIEGDLSYLQIATFSELADAKAKGDARRARLARHALEMLRLNPTAKDTRADLWLRQSSNSPGRRALLAYYYGNDETKAPGILDLGKKAAVAGATATGGATTGKAASDALGKIKDLLTKEEGAAPERVQPIVNGGFSRLTMIWLCIFAIWGAIFFQGWILMRLFVQAILGGVLLLLTPIALIAVAFGDTGREAFWHWVKMLMGTFVMKVIYAAVLGATIMMSFIVFELFASGSRVSTDAAGKAPALISWMFMAGFWWAAWFAREKLTSWIEITPRADTGQEFGIGGLYHSVALSRSIGGMAATPFRMGAGAAGSMLDKIRPGGGGVMPGRGAMPGGLPGGMPGVAGAKVDPMTAGLVGALPDTGAGVHRNPGRNLIGVNGVARTPEQVESLAALSDMADNFHRPRVNAAWDHVNAADTLDGQLRDLSTARDGFDGLIEHDKAAIGQYRSQLKDAGNDPNKYTQAQQRAAKNLAAKEKNLAGLQQSRMQISDAMRDLQGERRALDGPELARNRRIVDAALNNWDSTRTITSDRDREAALGQMVHTNGLPHNDVQGAARAGMTAQQMTEHNREGALARSSGDQKRQGLWSARDQQIKAKVMQHDTAVNHHLNRVGGQAPAGRELIAPNHPARQTAHRVANTPQRDRVKTTLGERAGSALDAVRPRNRR